MQTGSEQTAEPEAAGRPRRRWWLWVVVLVVVGLCIFLAILPHLASIGPIRNWLLRAALPQINGSIHAGSARLGWFSPIRFENLEIRSPDGEPAVSIARLEGNRALWRMIWGSDLGELRIERPEINVVLDEHGSNLRRIFPRHKPPNAAVDVRFVDGRVRVRGGDASRAWTAEPVNFAFRLRPGPASTDAQPRLEIEPGVLFSKAQLTPEACRDLLKYIAPVLAGATEASGCFSIELDRCEFPMTDFAQGEGAGRLDIHEMAIGPGPVVHELAKFLKVPPRLVTVEDEPVAFHMADRRIHHSQLTFRLQRMVIRTSGSVGVDDGSLALVAELTIPEHMLDDRPALAGLAKRTLRIPIKGTLHKPRIDAEALLRSLPAAGFEVLGDVLRNESFDLGKLLENIRQRRRERLDERRNPQPDPKRNEPARPLRRLIRNALDEAIQEPKPQP